MAARLREAARYHRQTVSAANACRLVFSEADRIPGLVVDRYNDVISLQILTQAWDRPERREAIVAALREFTGVENIIERVDDRIRTLEQLPALESSLLHGSKS